LPFAIQLRSFAPEEQKLGMNKLQLLILGTVLTALVFAVEFFANRPSYYPQVTVDVTRDLQIAILRQARPTLESCQSVSASLANAMSAVCATCGISIQACSGSQPDFARMFGEQPLSTPSARIPQGVVVYT